MTLLTTLIEHFDTGARKLLPYSLMLLLLLLNSVHLPFSAGSDIKAPLFLIGLYYWSIYRPTLIPPWMAFTAGILADLLGGLPLGLNACVFVIVQWTISDQRRFLMGQSFVMIWFGFLLLCLFSSFAEWCIFGLMNMAWPSLKSLAFSILLGMALFPFISVILHWTHKILPAPVGSSLEPSR
jgi:rod shape-determining protein MreD